MARELNIRIELENDAFGPYQYECRQEVARILEEFALEVKQGHEGCSVGETGHFADINGNIVREWETVQTEPVS
jgi:hypothetical protein